METMQYASAERTPPEPHDEELREQRFVVRGVSWKEYVLLREALDIPGLRMTYCEGALELMSPSPEHELRKTNIGRLIETWALERDVMLYGYGSATFRREAKQRGAEPDECYVVGQPLAEMPDIAIEVILTSGGIDKLEVYRGLGVPEVWLYEDGALRLYALREGAYHAIERSELLPDLDPALIATYAQRDDQPIAVRELRDALRAERR